MDPFAGKPTIRCQLGRHLAETPYTAAAIGSDNTSGTHYRASKSDSADGLDHRRQVAAESPKKVTRDHAAASGSGSGPRFAEAPVTINDAESAFAHSDYGLPDADAESSMSDNAKQHSKAARRVLTQRYQLDQMKTIRKRISTEDWMVEQLDRLNASAVPENQTAHYSPAGSNDYASVETVIDIEELLACVGDTDRRAFLEMKLHNCPASSSDIEAFINECIERTRPL